MAIPLSTIPQRVHLLYGDTNVSWCGMYSGGVTGPGFAARRRLTSKVTCLRCILCHSRNKPARLRRTNATSVPVASAVGAYAG